MNKKGLSEMISYVLIISIGIALSIAVFSWLKIVSQDVKPPVNCKEDTYITIEDIKCHSETDVGIDIDIRNSGRFNISGVVVTVGYDSKGLIYYLKPKGSLSPVDGQYFFPFPLAPGETFKTRFENKLGDGTKIESINSIKVQPFIFVRNKNKFNKVMCKDAVIKQNIETCSMIEG